MEKQLTDQQVEEFLVELRALLEKYNIKNVSICGTNEEKYLGVICVGQSGFGEFFESVLNISRLFQSAREKVYKIIDEYAKHARG